MPLRVLTWNVNGVRSLKPDLVTVIGKLDADLLCFQETKINKEQLDSRLCFVPGYTSYYSWCKYRGGYSGTCVYVRDASLRAIACCDGLTGHFDAVNGNTSAVSEFGDLDEELSATEKKTIDEEGRTVMLKFRIQASEAKASSGDGEGETEPKELVLICVYAPRVDGEKPDRLPYKMRFFDVLKRRIGACLRRGYAVVLVGDLNLTHSDLDVREGYEARERSNEDTRQSREWLSSLLAEHNLIDLYRQIWPQERDSGYTNWCQLVNARVTNFGCRIDYEIASCFIAKRLLSCEALQNVAGSDHCPVMCSLDLQCDNQKSCDVSIKSICATRFMPEFAGGQQRTILGYFSRPSSAAASVTQSSQLSNESVQSEKRNVLDKTCADEPNAKKRKITQFFTKTDKPKSPITIDIEESDSVQDAAKVQDDDSKNTEPQTETETETETEKEIESSQSLDADDSKKRIDAFAALKKAQLPPPLCRGHREPCVLRVVKASTSTNRGRAFWCCARPDGAPSNPAARCRHFVWADVTARS